MTGWLLDTNIASHLICGDRPEIDRRLTSLPMGDISISAVTEGELLYGLARRGHPVRLTGLVHQFLLRVDVLDWDRDAAAAYGDLRATCERAGVSLTPLDMMIAAHAVAVDAVLVTRDNAFGQVPAPLRTEAWAP